MALLSRFGQFRASFAAALIVLLTVALVVSPAHSDSPDDPDRVWIYGKNLDLTTDGCSLKGRNPVLQVKRNGRWRTVAEGKEFPARKTCKGNGKYIYKYRYRFTLEDLGRPVPGEPYTLLEARQFWTAYGKPISRPFVKTVLPSEQAHEQWLIDGVKEYYGVS